jgi:hypothetical protein
LVFIEDDSDAFPCANASPFSGAEKLDIPRLCA